jgi:hypothetical protein
MIELRINRTTMIASLVVLLLAAFGLGIWLSRGSTPQATTPAVDPAANPAALVQPPAVEVQPQANPPAQQPAAPPASPLEAVLAGGELTPEQDASVARIAIDEALPKLSSPDVIWVDTRTAQEYGESHIAGAVSYPAYEQDARLEEIERDKEIILYCA